MYYFSPISALSFRHKTSDGLLLVTRITVKEVAVNTLLLNHVIWVVKQSLSNHSPVFTVYVTFVIYLKLLEENDILIIFIQSKPQNSCEKLAKKSLFLNRLFKLLYWKSLKKFCFFFLNYFLRKIIKVKLYQNKITK